jgi:outer membrane protein assembly complex protein YaeT
MIRDTYGEVGYIETVIQPSVDFAEEPGTVELTFKVEEGRPVRIGQVRIEGNRLTQDKVIRRELRFYPEEPVNTKLVEMGRKRLEGLGIFKPESVHITTLATADPDVRDVLVRVEETETTNLILGAGISSNSGVLGNVSIVNRNFDLSDVPKSSDQFWRGESYRGAGQYLGLILEPGTELQRYRLDFREPRLWDSTVGFSSSTFFFTRDRDTYDEQRVGENFGFSKELWETVSAFVNFRVEGIDIKNVRASAPQDLKDVAGTSLLTSIELGLVKDTTDSYLFPTEGYRASGSVEQACAMGGDYTFTKVNVDARKYWTVTRDVLDRKSTLAVRGHAGFIPGEDAPIFERFYAGGTGSIRGFKFRGVGPREGKTELGGSFMALASAEYQFPIFEKVFSGVLFLDTGTVEKKITVTTWRASVGFGIRFSIPFFGPVPFSFDFGFPISKGDGDKTEIFSFSIGTAF